MITALASEDIKTQFEVVEEDNVEYEIKRRMDKL